MTPVTRKEWDKEFRHNRQTALAGKRHRAICESACTGVEFTGGDPDGAVRALVEALEPLAIVAQCYDDEVPDGFQVSLQLRTIRAARAALARVRVADGGDAEKGETK